ncbi:hypothetical protein Tco_1261345 [Tanacetum coccineum]
MVATSCETHGFQQWWQHTVSRLDTNMVAILRHVPTGPRHEPTSTMCSFLLESMWHQSQDFRSVLVKISRALVLVVCKATKNMTITRSGMTPEAIEELINRRVEEALVAYEATRAANALEAEIQSQNDSDNDNGNGRNENGGEHKIGRAHSDW